MRKRAACIADHTVNGFDPATSVPDVKVPCINFLLKPGSRVFFRMAREPHFLILNDEIYGCNAQLTNERECDFTISCQGDIGHGPCNIVHLNLNSPARGSKTLKFVQKIGSLSLLNRVNRSYRDQEGSAFL